jgi:hypothetical protein
MESFFALLQKNVLNRRRWVSQKQLRLAIMHWVKGTYNRKRRQRGLGKSTPIEYEQSSTQRSPSRPERRSQLNRQQSRTQPGLPAEPLLFHRQSPTPDTDTDTDTDTDRNSVLKSHMT